MVKRKWIMTLCKQSNTRFLFRILFHSLLTILSIRSSIHYMWYMYHIQPKLALKPYHVSMGDPYFYVLYHVPDSKGRVFFFFLKKKNLPHNPLIASDRKLSPLPRVFSLLNFITFQPFNRRLWATSFENFYIQYIAIAPND